MQQWSDSKYIKNKLQKRWDSGQILTSLFLKDDIFPIRISLKIPKQSEMSECYTETIEWIQELYRGSKNRIGFGYELEEKTIAHKLLGKNDIPTHATIQNATDVLRLLKKEKEADAFLKHSERIVNEWPILHDWICKYPLKSQCRQLNRLNKM